MDVRHSRILNPEPTAQKWRWGHHLTQEATVPLSGTVATIYHPISVKLSCGRRAPEKHLVRDFRSELIPGNFRRYPSPIFVRVRTRRGVSFGLLSYSRRHRKRLGVEARLERCTARRSRVHYRPAGKSKGKSRTTCVSMFGKQRNSTSKMIMSVSEMGPRWRAKSTVQQQRCRGSL